MTYLPPKCGQEREAAILAAIEAGELSTIFWAPVCSSLSTPDGVEHSAMFLVTSDALMLKSVETKDGSSDVVSENVRINVCAETQQKIADALCCSLLTAQLADLVYQQASLLVGPKTMSGPGGDMSRMADTSWMIAHNGKINDSLPGMLKLSTASAYMVDGLAALSIDLQDMMPLTSTVGKHWIISEKLAQKPNGTACNYGWHFEGQTFAGSSFEERVLKTGRLIQGCGYKHNNKHTDYSQTVVLVQQKCLVDGGVTDLREVLRDPILAKLASHTGPMTYLRQG